MANGNCERLGQWISAFERGDNQAVMAELAEDLVFSTPANVYDAIIPYVGIKSGLPDVLASFGQRASLIETVKMDVIGFGADGDMGWARINLKERVIATGATYDTEAAHVFHFNAEGKDRSLGVVFRSCCRSGGAQEGRAHALCGCAVDGRPRHRAHPARRRAFARTHATRPTG